MRAVKLQKRKKQAVLIYDGTRWLLWPAEAEAPAAEADGPDDTLPPAVTEALLELQINWVRILTEGGLCRPDIPVPDKMRAADAATLVLQEAADISGEDVNDFICAGKPFTWTGTPDAALLAGVYRRPRVLALKQCLDSLGIGFDGIASLELACMLSGERDGASPHATLIVGTDASLAVPSPRPRPLHSGPQPFSGGLRHITADADSWAARFRRIVTCFDRNRPLSLLVLGADTDSTAAQLLCDTCGFRDVRPVDRCRIFARAAQLVLSVRTNTAAARLPVTNPYVPRKRFSHAWYLVPALIMLCLPPAIRFQIDRKSATETATLQEILAEKQALSARIKAAEALTAKAKKAYEADAAKRMALGECRRPLSAAVQTAYFFCRFAGRTVLLQEMTERDGVVQIKGIYADPEDGLRMNADLTAYAKENGLRILKNTTGIAQDDEGMPASNFEMILDYSKMTLGGGDR